MTDEEIIKALCSTSLEQERALKQLYRDKGAAFKQFFKSKGISHEISDDILQDVITNIFVGAKKYIGKNGISDNSANAWMWTIARNRMNDYLNQKLSTNTLRVREKNKATNQLRRNQAIKDGVTVGNTTAFPYIEPAKNEAMPNSGSLNDSIWLESHRNELTDGESSLIQDASIRRIQLEIDICMSNGIVDFCAEYPDRSQVLMMQMDGESIDSISRRRGRTVAATKEYLSQCRIKLKPFIEHCRLLIAT